MHVGVAFLGIAILTHEQSCLIYNNKNINAKQPSKLHAIKAARTALGDIAPMINCSSKTQPSD